MVRIKTNIFRKRSILPLFFIGAFLLVGGVFAYNHERAIYNNEFKLGAHVATHTEVFNPPDNWNPCEEIPKTLVTTNDSSHDIYVRLSYDEFWRMRDDAGQLPLLKNGVRLAIINFQNVDDWELRDDGWYYFKEALKPNDSTTSLFKSVTLNCDASFGGTNVCRQTPTGYVCEKPADDYENAKYHLKITVQTTDDSGGFPRDELCQISVNPNGGTFLDDTDVHTENVRCGTNYDLSSINYTDHELRDWTLNESNIYTNTTIEVTEPTSLVANWLSTIRHNVTIDPNGGSYAGATTPTSYEVREGSIFNIGAATRDGYFVDYWQIVGDGHLTSDSFVVTDDITLQAHWDKAVARIERTGKIYNSIMSAEAEAQTDDIITLLVDTLETVTNTKKVTLDLNSHTVIGSLTNTTTGNITLLNGEINNPNGAAAINDGILTLGINDYNADGSANIINDDIRLIGTTAGLEQTNDTYQFYFYDGYLEGDLGLIGGYDGAPFYRRTYDDLMVYFFPFVEHMELGDRVYQHVELKNADRAVSKTSVHGDIYYYNLQDNINTSAITGYKIYAVRDFDASYPITIAENVTIDFDVSGYEVSGGDDWIINGVFNISDSKTSGEDGEIKVSRTIQNRNHLSVTGTTISSLSNNTLLNNTAKLTLRNATLLSPTATTINMTSGTPELDFDENSYVISNASNKETITIGSGRQITINNGTIRSTGYRAIVNNGTLNITGGHIEYNGPVGGGRTIYNNGSVTMNGGVIATNNIDSVQNANSASFVMNGGLITTTTNVSNYGTTGSIFRDGYATINGGTVSISTSYSVNATICNNCRGITINDGTVDVRSTYSSAMLLARSWTISTRAVISGGSVSVHTTSGTAYGVYYDDNFTMTDGTITVTSDSGTTYGIHSTTGVITGGTITAEHYGIYDSSITLGTDDNEISIEKPDITGGLYGIYAGSTNYYDGILKGGTNAYQTGAIKTIPDGAIYHTETIDNKENCWLVEGENYLEVNGAEYNSLAKAYNAAESGDTITVIADFATQSKLPTNPSGKVITIDLNGHSLTYSQTLTNNGTLNFMDSSDEKTGVIRNDDAAVFTNNGTINYLSGTALSKNRVMTNNGTLNIADGTIRYDGAVGGNVTIYNSGSIAMNGGTITTSNINNIQNTDGASFVINDGLIATTTNVSNYGTTGSIFRNGYITINNGTISISTSYSVGATVCDGCRGLNINSGTINVESTSTNAMIMTRNWSVSTRAVISGGNMSVHTTSAPAYGIYYDDNLTMTGGTITVTSDSGTAYGIHTTTGTITGGIVTAKHYGVYDSSITLGADDGEIDIEHPEIVGGLYGVYAGSNNFYDGVLKGGTNAYQAGVIKTIPDGAIYHTETIDNKENCWLVEGENYLEVNGVEYNSLIKAYAAAESGDTITVIANFSTQSKLPTNPRGKEITIDLNGHNLTYSQSLINNGTLNFMDSSNEETGVIRNDDASVFTNNGTINFMSGTAQSKNKLVTNYGTFNLSGGTIESIYNSSNAASSYAFWNYGRVNTTGGTITSRNINTIWNENNGSVVVNGGTITADVAITNWMTSAYLISHGSSVTINSGQLSITTNYSIGAYIVADVPNVTIQGGNLTATSIGNHESCVIYGNSSASTRLTMSGGTIAAHSETTPSYGISGMITTITGGTILSTSNSNTAYGIYNSYNTITNGTINAGNYGIYGRTTTLGADDGEIDIEYPEVIGGSYALYDGTVSFYDGILKGSINAYQDSSITRVATDAEIFASDEIIDEIEYDVRYLIPEHDVAQIGTTKYTSLRNAIAAANVGDTIELIDDNNLFYSLQITSDKDLTIDMAGYDIYAANPIENNGHTIITNSNNESSTITYKRSGSFITNKSYLDLNGISLSSKETTIVNSTSASRLIIDGINIATSAYSYAIQNSGTLNIINNTTIRSAGNGIYQNGTNLTVADSIIQASDYGIHFYSTSTNIISDSTITAGQTIYQQNQSNQSTTTIARSILNGAIHNVSSDIAISDNSTINANNSFAIDNSGTINIEDSQIAINITNSLYNNRNPLNGIYNNGTLSLENAAISQTVAAYQDIPYRVIYNDGSVSITNSTTSLNANNVPATSSGFYAMTFYNAGSAIISSSDISISGATAYTIYSDGGTTDINSGSITANGKNVYGIYIAAGEVTMGEAESTSSSNYGTEFADVSITDPEVTAIGTDSGIGVKKTEGKFNYYDGKITGSTAAKPELPTKIEYLYEADNFTDDDGNKYCYLVYMR